MQRLCGLAVFGVGVAALVWLAEVSYRASKPWSDLLAAVGMPLMLLLVLFAFCMVGLGAWLVLRRRRRERPDLFVPTGK